MMWTDITFVFTIIIWFLVALSLVVIGAVAAVLFGLLTEKLFDKSAVLALLCALAMSVTASVFPLHHPLSTRALSMLSILMSVSAILAWKIHQLTGILRSIFALSTAIVLYLNVSILVAQVINHVSLFKAWPLAPFSAPSILVQLAVVMLFLVAGTFATSGFAIGRSNNWHNLPKRNDCKTRITAPWESKGRTEMRCLFTPRKETTDQNAYATDEDFHKLFTEDVNNLYLLSFLLTANYKMAERCFVAGLDECANESHVFQEWAHFWARRVIVCNAIRTMAPHPNPARGAQGRFHPAREGDPTTVRPQDTQFAGVLALEDFERFVYVMSVLERYTDQNCAVLLGVSPQEILDTRHRALQLVAQFSQRGMASKDNPVNTK